MGLAEFFETAGKLGKAAAPIRIGASLSHDAGTLEVYYTLYYTQGSVGTSYLSLWWSDGGPTMCLRGWYRDGSLTPRKEDATAVEFTGKSANIDWNLPAHPSTLPSLGSCR